MSVASGDLGDITGGHVKIGAESHVGRNVGILVGVIAVGAMIFGVASYLSRQDASKLSQLESFRAAYADKCDVAAFRGDASPLLRDTYLKTSELQQAVATQQAALSSGASCEAIAHALKVAEFPMPPPPSTPAH